MQKLIAPWRVLTRQKHKSQPRRLARKQCKRTSCALGRNAFDKRRFTRHIRRHNKNSNKQQQTKAGLPGNSQAEKLISNKQRLRCEAMNLLSWLSNGQSQYSSHKNLS